MLIGRRPNQPATRVGRRLRSLTTAVLAAWLIGARADGHQRGLEVRTRTEALPNVILIVVDTLRADAVGSYGGDPTVTPHLDRVARDGVRFSAASVAPWTAPAIMSLLTSSYPSEHGHGSRWKIGGGVRSLPEILSDAGYATAAFVDFKLPDMARGFATYESFASAGRMSENVAPLPFERARQWIQRRPHRPFFVLIHTYEAHDYFFVKPYQRAVADRQLPDYNGPVRHWRPSTAPDAVDRIFTDQLNDAASAAYLKALYQAGVAAVDAEIGRFDQALRALNVWSDAVVIVTSDHGEGFDPVRRRLHHGGRLHEDLLRVPLIVRWPARLTRDISSELVSLLDVMPTVLQFANLPRPAAARGLPLFAEERSRNWLGLSRLRLVTAVPRDRDLMAEESVYFVRSDGQRETSDTHQFALYSRGTKLIRSPAHTELYELDTDPGETSNLMSLRPQVASSMRDRLRRIIHGLGPPAEVPDAAVLELLRSLGYIR